MCLLVKCAAISVNNRCFGTKLLLNYRNECEQALAIVRLTFLLKILVLMIWHKSPIISFLSKKMLQFCPKNVVTSNQQMYPHIYKKEKCNFLIQTNKDSLYTIVSICAKRCWNMKRDKWRQMQNSISASNELSQRNHSSETTKTVEFKDQKQLLNPFIRNHCKF